MDKLNVAIADDNEIMLQMLDHIVSSDEELQVVGKAGASGCLEFFSATSAAS